MCVTLNGCTLWLLISIKILLGYQNAQKPSSATKVHKNPSQLLSYTKILLKYHQGTQKSFSATKSHKNLSQVPMYTKILLNCQVAQESFSTTKLHKNPSQVPSYTKIFLSYQGIQKSFSSTKVHKNPFQLPSHRSILDSSTATKVPSSQSNGHVMEIHTYSQIYNKFLNWNHPKMRYFVPISIQSTKPTTVSKALVSRITDFER